MHPYSCLLWSTLSPSKRQINLTTPHKWGAKSGGPFASREGAPHGSRVLVRGGRGAGTRKDCSERLPGGRGPETGWLEGAGALLSRRRLVLALGVRVGWEGCGAARAEPAEAGEAGRVAAGTAGLVGAAAAGAAGRLRGGLRVLAARRSRGRWAAAAAGVAEVAGAAGVGSSGMR